MFNNSDVEDGFYPLFDLRHYPYTYQSRVATYDSKDIRIGEVVLLEDIIEDFIGALTPTPKITIRTRHLGWCTNGCSLFSTE